MENFKCDLYPATGSNNVRQLRPADISIVAAMGDSITAGFGAAAGSIFTVFTEYRGQSWSIGGDKTVDSYTTIPNIIKKYNPNVKGFSTGTGKATSSNAKMNVAVSGAVSKDMYEQALSLIYKFEDAHMNGEIDIANDWKLLTIFIGGNNLCEICNDPSANSPQTYYTQLESALDLLLSRVSRVFINLVQPVDVTELGKLSTGLCSLLHPFECPCAIKDIEVAKAAQLQYVQKIRELAALSKFQGRDDFKISVQPFFIETDVPMKNGKPDTSYFAPDCFHFSTKSHVAAGVGLWNNMFEAEGAKRDYWYIGEDIVCPGENDYIQ